MAAGRPGSAARDACRAQRSVLVHDQDQVRGQDGAQAVGDDDAGPPGHDPLQGILDQRFGFAVEVAGGLIENQDARVFENDARQGNALFLTAAKR